MSASAAASRSALILSPGKRIDIKGHVFTAFERHLAPDLSGNIAAATFRD
jgi:hypothetical protein